MPDGSKGSTGGGGMADKAARDGFNPTPRGGVADGRPLEEGDDTRRKGLGSSSSILMNERGMASPTTEGDLLSRPSCKARDGGCGSN